MPEDSDSKATRTAGRKKTARKISSKKRQVSRKPVKEGKKTAKTREQKVSRGTGRGKTGAMRLKKTRSNKRPAKKTVRKKTAAKKQATKSTTAGASEKKEREDYPEPPKPSEFNYLEFAVRRYLDDLEGIRDLARIVPPLLEKRASSVDSKIEKLLGPEKDGKHVLNSNRSLMRFMNLMRETYQIARGTQMFRENSVVSIVARFEELITSIATAFFTMNRGALITKEKSVTYEELLAFTTIEEAVASLLDRELFSLTKESHEHQVSYLDDTLKLGLKETYSDWEAFREACARRNLYIHASGRVNGAYLRQWNIRHKNGADKPNVGEYLPADDEYLTKVHDCFVDLGFQMGISALMRLHKDNLTNISSTSLDLGYRLLEQSNWTLAERIFNYLRNLPDRWSESDRSKRIVLINYCIALYQQGRHEEMEAILDSIDWTSSQIVFHIAIAVLREDYETAGRLVGKVGDGELTEDELRHWPLFNKFRESKEFRTAFAERFGEEYHAEVPRKDELLRDYSHGEESG